MLILCSSEDESERSYAIFRQQKRLSVCAVMSWSNFTGLCNQVKSFISSESTTAFNTFIKTGELNDISLLNRIVYATSNY